MKAFQKTKKSAGAMDGWATKELALMSLKACKAAATMLNQIEHCTMSLDTRYAGAVRDSPNLQEKFPSCDGKFAPSTDTIFPGVVVGAQTGRTARASKDGSVRNGAAPGIPGTCGWSLASWYWKMCSKGSSSTLFCSCCKLLYRP